TLALTPDKQIFSLFCHNNAQDHRVRSKNYQFVDRGHLWWDKAGIKRDVYVIQCPAFSANQQ
ncbi:MAG: hypothetical protein KBE15_08120, partial [Budvicia sp.]|nr:hypothetical protein [Budvicia sp.]